MKGLTKELLDVNLSKEEQSSDWGAETLTEAQQFYAAQDVVYLHDIKDKLQKRLERDGRMDLANACFRALWLRVLLDIRGFPQDIFSHH